MRNCFLPALIGFVWALALLAWSYPVPAAEMPEEVGKFGEKLAQPGEKILRLRLFRVTPRGESGNWRAGEEELSGTSVSPDNSMGLGVDFTLKASPALGFEIAATLPLDQEIKSRGANLTAKAPGSVIQAKMLPITLMTQYHLLPDAKIRPYLGMGINYTYFFSPDPTHALHRAFDGARELSLDAGYGWAAQLGVDLELGNDWLLNFDLKYLNAETTARFQSGEYGEMSTDIEINPWIIGLGVGRKF